MISAGACSQRSVSSSSWNLGILLLRKKKKEKKNGRKDVGGKQKGDEGEEKEERKGKVWAGKYSLDLLP